MKMGHSKVTEIRKWKCALTQCFASPYYGEIVVLIHERALVLNQNLESDMI